MSENVEPKRRSYRALQVVIIMLIVIAAAALLLYMLLPPMQMGVFSNIIPNL